MIIGEGRTRVPITVNFWRPATAPKDAAHPKAVLRTETGDISFTLPWAPKVVPHEGLSPEYTEVKRAGSEPYLVMSGRPLRGIELEFNIGRGGRQVQSVESTLRLLEKIANSPQRVYFAYGPSEGGLWRIMSLSMSSVERRQGTNEITAATVRMSLKRNIVNVINLGPVSNAPKPPVTSTPTTKPTTTARYHIVKSGDSLSAISLKYYKTTSKWPLIASANKIKNANLIYPGQKLLIP